MGSILGQLFQRSDDLLDFDVRNYENKAVLGDLKSGYLNSFGVFLTRELDETKRQAVFKSQSLGELKSVVSEKFFEERLLEFDRMNVSVIELYQHQLGRLESMLGPKGRAVADELMPLPKPLYWRKK